SGLNVHADVNRVSRHVNRPFWRLRVRPSILKAGSPAMYRSCAFAKKLIARVPSFSQQRVKHLVPDTAAIQHCSCSQHDYVAEGIPITSDGFSGAGIAQDLIRLEPGHVPERAGQT